MLFSFENLYRQYLACRRNKRNTLNALKFEARQEEHLVALREALVARTYVPARSVCFFAQGPKLREIFAADFCDRGVHHVLVNYLEHIWEPRFIHDSYACRCGKGVHAAVERLRQFVREATCNGTRRAWYLQLDIRNYFMTIDRDILYARVAANLNDDDALWLARVLIYHDCTENYVYRGPPGAYARIPPHKTLTGVPKNKGLPIGNLNSQFFANVYLDGFDQFVKHTLKCRHYIRYCDDFVLLSPDPEQLREWRKHIEAYLREKLALELKTGRERLRSVSDGVDFIGYIVRRDYLLVRRRVVNNLKLKLKAFEAELVRTGPRVRRFRFDRERLDLLFATLNSYLGHTQMASATSLWRALWQRHAWLAAYFTFDPASASSPAAIFRRPKHAAPANSTAITSGSFPRRWCCFRWESSSSSTNGAMRRWPRHSISCRCAGTGAARVTDFRWLRCECICRACSRRGARSWSSGRRTNILLRSKRGRRCADTRQ